MQWRLITECDKQTVKNRFIFTPILWPEPTRVLRAQIQTKKRGKEALPEGECAPQSTVAERGWRPGARRLTRMNGKRANQPQGPAMPVTRPPVLPGDSGRSLPPYHGDYRQTLQAARRLPSCCLFLVTGVATAQPKPRSFKRNGRRTHRDLSPPTTAPPPSVIGLKKMNADWRRWLRQCIPATSGNQRFKPSPCPAGLWETSGCRSGLMAPMRL